MALFGFGKKKKKAAPANVPAATAPIPAPVPTQQSSLSDILFGLPAATQQFPRFTPEQQQALNQVLQTGLTGLGQQPLSFEPIREAALRTFQQRVVPSLAERFTASFGPQRQSSGLPDILGQAATGLTQDLAAQEQLFNLQKQAYLQRLLETGLTPSFENIYLPGQPGALQGFAANPASYSGILSGLQGLAPQTPKTSIASYLGSAATGAATGGAIGGPIGAGIGGAVGLGGQLLSDIFGGKFGKGTTQKPGQSLQQMQPLPQVPMQRLGGSPLQLQQTPTSQSVMKYLQSSPNAPLSQAFSNIYQQAQAQGLI